MRSLAKAITVLAGVALTTPALYADTFEVDAAHSSVGFAVRHLMVSTVRGHFEKYTGTFDYDPANPTATKATAKIEAASITTANEKRDTHLKSPDFFDTAKFPDITFESTRAEGSGENLTLVGNLTIRGVTKEITLPITVSGPVVDPWGNTKIGFEGSTKINRQDFGISWSKALDGGGVVVGDEVKIEITFEGAKK